MNLNFTNRSRTKELIDAPVFGSSVQKNMKELNVINRLLGGNRTTLAGIKRLMTDKNRTYRIIDIGCGGGGTLLSISQWAKKNGYKVSLTGVDVLPEAISFASEACINEPNVRFFLSDYKKLNLKAGEYDIAVSSLFCHHLYDDELENLINELHKTAAVGVVINDLHRNAIAYYSIKYLTRLFSGSEMVKNDAPLSVSKGFKKSELRALINKMQVKSFDIKWFWAFRYMVLINKN